MLPITVNLQQKNCIVIGGGNVAYRRVQTLLAEGAKVTVISPDVIPKLAALFEKMDEMQLKWLKRPFRDGDTIGAFLVIAATNLRAVNEQIGYESHSNQLVNIVDDPMNSNFYFPAVGRKGLLSIAVSTEGASPVLAKKIRNEVMQNFDDAFEQYLLFVKQARACILSLGLEEKQKRKLLTDIVDNRYIDPTRQAEFLENMKMLTVETG